MDEIRITRARPAQAAQLSRIAHAAKAHWGYPEHWMRLWTPQLTITPDYIHDHEVWTGRLPDALAGFYSLNAQDGKALLENLWVLPEYMRQGAGRRMFTHALSRCSRQGYKIMQIEADPNAQGFYERMGAHQVGEHVSLLPDGQPRVLPVLEMEIE